MTKKTQQRKRHSDEFKVEALLLADKIGASRAAKQLDLHASQIYQWRVAAEKKSTTSERERVIPPSNRETLFFSVRSVRLDLNYYRQ